MVSPSLLLCLVHKTSLSSQHTLAHAHSHRQHKHTRTATHTLCKGFIIAGKIALKYMRLDVTMAEMGREGSKAVELCSPFTLQRHKALLRWRGEHVPRVHIPSAMHRRAPSVTYLVSCADSAVPESFSVTLSRASFPLFFDCLSGPEHITVTVGMISAFSDRCICFCHSQQSSPAPSLLPDLSQGSTTGKHGQCYLILLHAEDTILIDNCMFSGDPTFK